MFFIHISAQSRRHISLSAPSTVSLLTLIHISGKMTSQVMNKSKATESRYIALYSHWIALIISIAMSYYFRLPTDSKRKQCRDMFDKQCNEFLREHASPTVLPNFFNFGKIITTLVQNFFTATAIPRTHLDPLSFFSPFLTILQLELHQRIR